MNGAVRTVLQRDDVRKQLTNAAFVPESVDARSAGWRTCRAEIARWSAVREKRQIEQQ
jgi:hypothetical protein